MRNAELVSKYFSLNRTQSQLDFVDVPVNTDTPLYVDPFAISQRVDRWSQEAHGSILAYFQRVVDSIRDDHIEEARSLLQHLREPNETHLGQSRGRSKGAGIGDEQANRLLIALRQSSAVQTGFLSSLAECELMIDGIGPDKISDLTTNIIRQQLAEYTLQQCELLGISTEEVAIGPCFDRDSLRWESKYLRLPVAYGSPLLLVPKAIARMRFSYDHQQYYRHFTLSYLQAEHLQAGTALVHTLRNGKRKVYKEELEKYFPCTKSFLFEFSKNHPGVLDEYRDFLADLEEKGSVHALEGDNEPVVASALRAALRSIPKGRQAASLYHSLMIGVVEFLLFPQLLRPIKEKEINDGRKRIDILMENGAREGIFHRLHDIRKLPCAYVPIECKNYSEDLKNPELDQMIGRFSTNRGRVGIICCRGFEDRPLFIKRCQDTLSAQLGLILPFDDAVIDELLELVETDHRKDVDIRISKIVDEVWLA